MKIWLRILIDDIKDTAESIQVDDPDVERKIIHCAAVCTNWLEINARGAIRKI